MIVVKFFASLREDLGLDQLKLDASESGSVEELIELLSARGDRWRDALSAKNLLVAINQVHANREAAIADGDEVAIFPPVTGG
jgi:molybdopterin converting factor subunit 1